MGPQTKIKPKINSVILDRFFMVIQNGAVTLERMTSWNNFYGIPQFVNVEPNQVYYFLVCKCYMFRSNRIHTVDQAGRSLCISDEGKAS